MKKQLQLRLKPSEAIDDSSIKLQIAASASIKSDVISGYHVLRRSIDARGKQPHIEMTVEAYINEPFIEREKIHVELRDVSNAKDEVAIIGAGPAGLFAAIKLMEAGVRPLILERGKDVRARRRDLALLNKEGRVNPESNYCFGEGGAGTYSDGKLYTRSTKRGDVKRILNLLVQFGADDNILYDAHPHIGTNKLPQIITAMRNAIIGHGGKFLFQMKLTDLLIRNKAITQLVVNGNEKIDVSNCILATGHSARDIFLLMEEKNILIEFKEFALGVRVEHPQELIDSLQYHCHVRDVLLPPASYSLVQQVDEKGVFSFCMCPGGIIAPASTDPGELVVNGWSPSKRNNPFANSGIVVTVQQKDTEQFKKYGALAGMYFQQDVERKAFEAGGGKFVAPAQRLVDFTENNLSSSLPDCSYLPGIRSSQLGSVLPGFIHKRLQLAFRAFQKKMGTHGGKGFFTNEAVVVATESRTSSPVRIPREKDLLNHPQVENLYPCGEGAGYAGGIVSAAMDGERVAEKILEKIGVA